MKKITNNNKGFSLIELIIVIAIMAVLVAIIAPNLTKYLGSSKTNSDSKNKDEIEATLKTCITDYEMTHGSLGDVTCSWAGGTLALTGGDSDFQAIVNTAIDSSKTQSKVNSSQYAEAVIKKEASGSYKITVSFK